MLEITVCGNSCFFKLSMHVDSLFHHGGRRHVWVVTTKLVGPPICHRIDPVNAMYEQSWLAVYTYIFMTHPPHTFHLVGTRDSDECTQLHLVIP